LPEQSGAAAERPRPPPEPLADRLVVFFLLDFFFVVLAMMECPYEVGPPVVHTVGRGRVGLDTMGIMGPVCQG
jgi:hypothetical protein